MFLLSLTRKSIARHIDAHEVREFLRDGWVVTVATDGWLSSYTEGDGEVAVAESPHFSNPAAPDALMFTRAAFTQLPPSVEVRKELIGGRPLYYHAGPGGDFHCSTHVRALAAAGVRLEEDVERLPELFIYRYVSAPRTLFKGIHQLLSGQRLRFEHDGQTWRPAAVDTFAPPRRRPDAGASRGGGLSPHGDHTLDALREAMRAVARDRDRVQLLLSGGLDSSVLFKLAQSELGVNDSYSTGYPFELETNDVEKRYALTAAEAMGARHRFFVSTTGRFLRGFVETVSAAEEPVAHLQAVLLLLLFRDGLPTGRGTVVNGEGADGLYGLQLHRQMQSVDRFTATHPWAARALRPLGSPPLLPLVSSRVVVGATRAALRRLRRASAVLNIIGARWGPGVAASDPRHVLWRMGFRAFEMHREVRAWKLRWRCLTAAVRPDGSHSRKLSRG